MPLRAIHILANHESDVPEFKVLHGFERVHRLLENLYRPQYLKGQGTQSNLMRMAGMIAQKTTMAEVFRRRDPDQLEDLVGMLESAWAERFAAIPARKEN
jgi:hypothetical protein